MNEAQQDRGNGKQTREKPGKGLAVRTATLKAGKGNFSPWTVSVQQNKSHSGSRS